MTLPIPRRYLATRSNPSVSALPRRRQAVSFGSQEFTGSTNTFIVPPGVYSVSIVAVGRGGVPAVNAARGGSGGALAYVNDVPVRPGERLTVRNSAEASGVHRRVPVGSSAPEVAGWIVAAGSGDYLTNQNPGRPIVGAGYMGGLATSYGGAGAAGYKGNGGGSGQSPALGSGAGGGGESNSSNAGGGGGVGVYGWGSDGVGFNGNNSSGGTGGSGGENGQGGVVEYGCCVAYFYGGRGGYSGGGAGVGDDGSYPGGNNGRVRIVWPGNIRLFPDKNVGTP